MSQSAPTLSLAVWPPQPPRHPVSSLCITRDRRYVLTGSAGQVRRVVAESRADWLRCAAAHTAEPQAAAQ